MISLETFNNIKYYTKIILILLIVYLLLAYIAVTKPYEAILIACIVAVSILIIENIIIINNQALDPLNCDQCQISKIDVELPTTSETEPFGISDITSSFSNAIINFGQSMKPTVPSNDQHPNIDNNQLPENNSDIYEFKCIRVQKSDPDSNIHHNMSNNMPNNIPNNMQTNMPNNIPNNIETFDNLETFMNDNSYKNFLLTHKADALPPTQKLEESKLQSELDTPIENNDIVSAPINSPSNNTINTVANNNMNATTPSDTTLTNIPVSQQKSILDDDTYVAYQQNGKQAAEDAISLKENLYRMEIGNPQIVHPYIKDGKKNYDDIFTRSTNAPVTYASLNSELKYGDYNYVGPINNGMINPQYTFISPSNWYPIQPFPPVCVTNKECTTCPIQISNGQDYMNFATLEDFDKSRRFTGDMGINIDYVKNVLNNPNGF
jgi:hypothetical protein